METFLFLAGSCLLTPKHNSVIFAPTMNIYITFTTKKAKQKQKNCKFQVLR